MQGYFYIIYHSNNIYKQFESPLKQKNQTSSQ